MYLPVAVRAPVLRDVTVVAPRVDIPALSVLAPAMMPVWKVMDAPLPDKEATLRTAWPLTFNVPVISRGRSKQRSR